MSVNFCSKMCLVSLRKLYDISCWKYSLNGFIILEFHNFRLWPIAISLMSILSEFKNFSFWTFFETTFSLQSINDTMKIRFCINHSATDLNLKDLKSCSSIFRAHFWWVLSAYVEMNNYKIIKFNYVCTPGSTGRRCWPVLQY